MAEIAHRINHIALRLRKHFLGNGAAGTAQQRLGELQGDVRHLGFAVEIQHEVVRQRRGERAAGFEQFSEREIEI